MNIVWITLKFGQEETGPVFEIVGIFDTIEAAIKACNENPLCGIGPMELNKIYLNEADDWEGFHFPFEIEEEDVL